MNEVLTHAQVLFTTTINDKLYDTIIETFVAILPDNFNYERNEIIIVDSSLPIKRLWSYQRKRHKKVAKQ